MSIDGETGCVERVTVDAAVRLAHELAGDPANVVERRLAPEAPASVVLVDGVALDLVKRPMIAGAPADLDRVRELLAALATPGEIVAIPGRPVAGIIATTSIALYAGDIVARLGEPIALRLPHAAWVALARPARELRERTLWLEEPSTISSIKIDGATYTRGAVIGEWPGAADPALVDAAAQALASPRATGDTPPTGFTIAHRIDLSITEPTGATRAHHLELGALSSTGCAARADTTLVTLPVAACTAIVAAAAR
jgi:hypothetical protein